MVDEIALPAFGLVGHAFLMDLLVLRRQRRLLRRPKPLRRIELDALPSEGRVDRVPLTFPVGVFRPIGGLCVANVAVSVTASANTPVELAPIIDLASLLSAFFLTRRTLTQYEDTSSIAGRI
jgi:hypothetical protein